MFTVLLPTSVHSLDLRLTNGRLSSVIRDIGHYLMNENHPLILVRSIVHHRSVTKALIRILSRGSS